MKRTVLTVIALLAMVSTSNAGGLGSFFGALTTAETIGKGEINFNGRLGLADATSFGGGITYGVSDNMDARFQLGSVDIDAYGSTTTFAGDVKLQIWDKSATSSHRSSRSKNNSKPFDLALGAYFETISMDVTVLTLKSSLSVTQIGVSALASFPPSKGSITPYGRLNIRNESITAEVDLGLGAVKVSDSQIQLGFNGGLAWSASPTIKLFGELQLDGNTGAFFGANFSL